jgi:hypothetical protein
LSRSTSSEAAETAHLGARTLFATYFSLLRLIVGPRVFRTEEYVYLNTYFKFLLLTFAVFPSFLQFCREAV